MVAQWVSYGLLSKNGRFWGATNGLFPVFKVLLTAYLRFPAGFGVRLSASLWLPTYLLMLAVKCLLYTAKR